MVEDLEGFEGIILVLALQICCLSAKLIGAVDWSWFWVLFPLWIVTAIAMASATVYIVINIVSYVQRKFDRD